ncbi:MAG: MBOAT family O-acyltransferase, partial [Oscillospiraceae bacterium]
VLGAIGIQVGFPELSLLLPVGISFYTFQALGYAIDVYRGTVEHEENFLKYALFVSFFPQLVAGPIERSSNLLPQFSRKHSFSFDNYAAGMRLMLIGFFKKVVIADNLSIAVERYYANLEIWPGPLLLLGIFLFAIQIYCDFSAYSDIARGAAKVLDFDLMKNFDHPYFSHSISEFWRRWHISLGSWFRDYMFYPILRSKWCMQLTKKLKKSGHKKIAKVLPAMIAQIIVWLSTGLWHGARITYVFWGGLHGFYQIVENIWGVYFEKSDKVSLSDKYPKAYGAFQMLRTFALVCVGYVFFRSENLHQAWFIISRSVRGWGTILSPVSLFQAAVSMIGSNYSMLVCLVSVMILLVIELIEIKNNSGFEQLVGKLSFGKQWAIYYGLMLFIALYGAFGASAFIYFQF